MKEVSLQEFVDSVQKDMRDLATIIADTNAGLILMCRVLADVDSDIADHLASVIEKADRSDQFPLANIAHALRRMPDEHAGRTEATSPVQLRLVYPDET